MARLPGSDAGIKLDNVDASRLPGIENFIDLCNRLRACQVPDTILCCLKRADRRTNGKNGRTAARPRIDLVPKLE